MANNKKDDVNARREQNIQDIKNLDAVVNRLLKDNVGPLAGSTTRSEMNNIYDEFSALVRNDSYNFMKTKSSNINTYNYVSNALMGRRANNKPSKNDNPKQAQIENRLNMEKIFMNGDGQAAALFLNNSSDINHICDEIDSICAYIYQLDEAVLMLRDNIMNNEQSIADLPFDVSFKTSDINAQEYQKVIIDTIKETGILTKLNDHVIPKNIKYGRYYVLTIPYSEIGVKMLDQKANQTRSVFNYSGIGNMYGGPSGTGISESQEVPVDENYTFCMENVDKLLDGMYENENTMTSIDSDKNHYRATIEYNLSHLLVNDDNTPPNVTGIQESTWSKMSPDLQKIVDDALKNQIKKFNTNINPKNNRTKNDDKSFIDATVDPSTVDSIPGCYIKLVDPRQMVPIKIFDHTLGYYYFENYVYVRNGTTVTDILSNQVNFNDQNMIIDSIVSSVLRSLKYGDLLEGNNDFKSMIMNCVLYAERRQNPVRMKFIPAEYVTEFKTNCDEDGNGQPVLLKSLIWGRLYVSLLMFNITSIITKSTDTEFYYLKEGLLSQSYEDQVNDIIEQFRNSNVDITQIINGDILHGNRAINKRYFMCTGTQDQKPFDMEVISGQQVDLHNDFLIDLRKMCIGATGIPALAVDYMDEVEFATIAKMTNARTSTRSNNIQIDLNSPTTELVAKVIKYSKPNAVPEDVLSQLECKYRETTTIHANISADEVNNNIATADNMVDTYYGGQNTETPPAVEYEKEEVRKRLIMKLSSTLPWGFLESIISDCKVAALTKQKEREMIQKNAENAE